MEIPNAAIESPSISIETSINNSTAEIDPSASYEERRKALLKIHSVENEADKIRQMREQGLSEAEMQLYTHDQVINQVTEHSVGVPYNTLTIVAKPDGRFTMYGMDILQMYKETAEMTSKGSQQWSEFHAYDNLYKRIQEGANVAIEVSPAYYPTTENPKPAERSFGFLHTVGEYSPQLQGTVIKEHLLRKDTKPGDLMWSIKMQQGMQYLAGLQPTPAEQIKSRLDIVEAPVAFTSKNPDNIDPFLQVAGISEADIQFSNQAKAMLEEGGASLLQNYHQLIDKLSKIENKQSIQYLLTKRRAEALIEKVFILGSKIRSWLRDDSLEHPYDHLDDLAVLTKGNDAQYYHRIYVSNRRYANELEIRGGSDCPPVTKSIEGIFNKNPLEGSLHRGESSDKPHESNTTCSRCGICQKVAPVRVIEGHYYCVDCKKQGPKVEA
jgi:hypothetical protein